MGFQPFIVNVTPNEISYVLANTNTLEITDPFSSPGVFGTATSITANGSILNDLVTDCVKTQWGPPASSALQVICNAGLNGLGLVLPGEWTELLAQDLLAGSGQAQAGNALMPRAEISFVSWFGAPIGTFVTAVAGIPQLNFVTTAAIARGLLTIRLRTSPGVR